MTQIQQTQNQDQVKVQMLPYRKPRKRRTEARHFIVKWVEDGVLYFRWFARDVNACRFLDKLTDAGFEARIIMK